MIKIIICNSIGPLLHDSNAGKFGRWANPVFCKHYMPRMFQNGMGRKRRFRLLRGNTGTAKDKKRPDHRKDSSAGTDIVERFGLKGEPNIDKHKNMYEFVSRLQEEIKKPGFSRDKYKSNLRALGVNEALIGLVDAIATLNEDPRHTCVLGITRAMNEKRIGDAKRLIDKAKQLYDYDAYRELGDILVYEGKLEEALDLYDKNLATKPRASTINSKAEVLRDMGRIPELLDLYDQWDAQFHDEPDFLAGKAHALVAAGRLDEAEKVALRSLKLDDDLPIYVYIVMGDLQLARGDPKGAIKLYNRALDIDENETEAYTGKANALAALGMYDEAISVCNRRLNITPTQGYLHRARDRIRAQARESSNS